MAAFPTDPSRWTSGPSIDFRPVALGQSVERGAFEVRVVGAGEYFVVGDRSVPLVFRKFLEEPSVLEDLVPSAARVRVDEGGRTTVLVTTRE